MGDWSSGMILVSGTRGPGFNSRIAPIFPQLPHNFPAPMFGLSTCSIFSFMFTLGNASRYQHHLFYKIMKSFALLDSSEAEEIIKLRVDLAKAKQKIGKYEEMIVKVDQFETVIAQLVEQFNNRQALLSDICTMTSAQILAAKLDYQIPASSGPRDKIQQLQQMMFRHEELYKSQEREEGSLANVVRQLTEMIKQYKSMKESHKEMEKEHSACTHRLAALQKQTQKLRLLEAELSNKQNELLESTKSKDILEEQLTESTRRCDHLENRLAELQAQLEEKGRLITAQQQRESQGYAVHAEREQVLERCTNLMEMLEIRDQEYLTHYFRSNGLPLEIQRSYKSKYEMVFD